MGMNRGAARTDEHESFSGGCRSLFIALQQLQRAGLIRNEYYSISEAGRQRLR